MPPSGTDRSTRSATDRLAGRLARLAPVCALLVMTTACSAAAIETWKRGGYPEGVTNHTDRMTTLWQGSWVAALMVGGLMWGLILWSVVRFRRPAGETGLPAQIRYNVPIETLYTAVPLIVVLVFFFFTARDEAEILQISDNPDNIVNVVGKRWSWDFNYLDANGEPDVYETGTPGRPPTLYLPVGESVQFRLTARDVVHSFWVPAFLFKMDNIPGRVNTFEVVPTREGVFAGKCAELCGVDHSRMLFSVRVVTPQEFDAHLQELRDRGQVGELPTDLGPKQDLDEGPASQLEGEQ